MKSKPATTRQIILETNTVGQHRLVTIVNGVPKHSPWIERHSIGVVGGIFHHVGGAGPAVPAVFRVSAVAHEELHA